MIFASKWEHLPLSMLWCVSAGRIKVSYPPVTAFWTTPLLFPKVDAQETFGKDDFKTSNALLKFCCLFHYKHHKNIKIPFKNINKTPSSWTLNIINHHFKKKSRIETPLKLPIFAATQNLRPRTGEAGVAVGSTSTAWEIMPSPRPRPSWGWKGWVGGKTRRKSMFHALEM